MSSGKWMGFILGSLIAFNGASAWAQVVVRVRPPRAVVERRTVPPDRGYVWVPGYQRWDGNRYAWVPGTWQRPPRPNARWVPYRWERRGNGWVLREGRWR
jgi:YXWGXW repeat-containing protein